MRWALAVGVCAALALGGCGGGGGSDTVSVSSSTTQAATATSASQRSTAGQQAKGTQTEGSAAKRAPKDKGSSGHVTAKVRLVKVPPISSAPAAGSTKPAPGVKTVKGGDNSVQEYGVEADETERTEAAIALQAYLNARSAEDWRSTCSYLAQRAKDQLQAFLESAQGKAEGLSGCADAMAAFGKGSSSQSQDPTITEVLSLRGEGDVPGNPSYLIFTGPPGKTLYSMPMYLEGDGWKVGLALPAELPV